MSNNLNEESRVVWVVVSGEKTGGEEPHENYSNALQALIYEAENIQRDMKMNPNRQPIQISLVCETLSENDL